MNTPFLRAVRRSRRGACRAAGALAGVALAATLAGCAPMRWERDGLALDTGGPDWQDCRSQSIALANRVYLTPYPRLYIARDAHGRSYTAYGPSPYPNRFMIEQDYLDRCLRERGYQRVAVPPANELPPGSASIE